MKKITAILLTLVLVFSTMSVAVFAVEGNSESGIRDTDLAQTIDVNDSQDDDYEALPFIDVTPNNWFYDSVVWAVKEKITSGTSENTFSPNAICTRAQLVTLLWRAAGSPSVPATDTTTVFPSPHETNMVEASQIVAKVDLKYVASQPLDETDMTAGAPSLDEPDALKAAVGGKDASQLTPENATGFTDVTTDDYFYEALLWAQKNDIISGTSATTFSPKKNISREQLVAIIYRYVKYTGADVSVGEDTNILSYDDATSIAEYAIPAFQWAVGAGVVTGKTATTLAPKATSTRAEIVTILKRVFNPDKKITSIEIGGGFDPIILNDKCGGEYSEIEFFDDFVLEKNQTAVMYACEGSDTPYVMVIDTVKPAKTFEEFVKDQSEKWGSGYYQMAKDGKSAYYTGSLTRKGELYYWSDIAYNLGDKFKTVTFYGKTEEVQIGDSDLKFSILTGYDNKLEADDPFNPTIYAEYDESYYFPGVYVCNDFEGYEMSKLYFSFLNEYKVTKEQYDKWSENWSDEDTVEYLNTLGYDIVYTYSVETDDFNVYSYCVTTENAAAPTYETFSYVERNGKWYIIDTWTNLMKPYPAYLDAIIASIHVDGE